MGSPRLCWGPDADGNVLRTERDRVVGFGPEVEADSDGRTCERGRIEPGAVNAHTHIYSGLAPLGMPAPQPKPRNFVEILERVWWRLDQALDRKSLRAAARLYVAESLLAGTTTLIDHHESPALINGSLDILADTCEELGTRAVLCFGATERNQGREEARKGLAECRRFIESNQRPLVRGLVALHASFTVSDETIREAGELCRELDTVLHVHLAEDGADVEDAKARGYAGPLERLLELDALPPGSIMAHGVFLDENQVKTAAERGIWLVQNPRSNEGNEVGYPRALGASERVALGTDGYPSRMFEERAALTRLAIEHGDEPAAVEARGLAGHGLATQIFDLPFAPLAEGAAADAVSREGTDAVHVMVAGREVVTDRELRTAEYFEIRIEAERAAPRLWKRVAALS